MPCPKSRNKASNATGSQRSARTQNPKGAQSLLPDSSKKTLDCIIPDAKPHTTSHIKANEGFGCDPAGPSPP